MSLLSRWRGRKSQSQLDLIREVYGTIAAKAGVDVTYKSALQCTVALACVRVLSEDTAMLPLKVFRRNADGTRTSGDADLQHLLDVQPNDWQTAMEFREQIGLHAALCGGGFALKVRVRGKVAELLPLQPQWVTVLRDSQWNVAYRVRISPNVGDGVGGAANVVIIPREDMLHLRGPSWDGVTGLDGVKMAREAIGLAIATEEHHASMHKNGAKIGGVMSVEGTLDEAQYKQLKAWIQQHTGSSNAFDTLLLDRKAEFTPYAMTGVDSEHLATRKFQIEEVCRGFRVFPQMVGYSDKTATFASAEAFFLAHAKFSILPWARRWESVLARDVLEGNREQYIKLSLAALERADMKTRYASYSDAITRGCWMLRNEARALEDMDPVDGFDEPLRPLNMIEGDDPAAQDTPPATPQTEGALDD
jgi:HK97 family phage portal protein